MAKKKKATFTAPTVDLQDFTHHPVANFLGIRIVSVTRKRVHAEMRITPSHINRAGRVGGGMIMAFADILGARGTVANLPRGARTATIESKTNFFARGIAPKLTGISIPLHIGRTTMVWQTTITNADKTRVAIVTQTQIVMPGRHVAANNGSKRKEG